MDPVQRNNVSIKSLILDLTALQSLAPRADKFPTVSSPLIFQQNWWKKHCKSQSRSPDTSVSRVLTASGLKRRKTVILRAVAEQAQGTKWNIFLSLVLSLISEHSARNLDTNQTAAHTSTTKAVSGLREKMVLPVHLIFFLYIEWVSAVVLRCPEHLYTPKHNILEKAGLFREIRNPCGREQGGDKNNAIIFRQWISGLFPLFISALLPVAFVLPATRQM